MPHILQVHRGSAMLLIRRVLEYWPYVFIVVSATGLTYIAVSAAR